jgi:hypothetical protein
MDYDQERNCHQTNQDKHDDGKNDDDVDDVHVRRWICQHLHLPLSLFDQIDNCNIDASSPSSYTTLTHFYQIESWDCGVTCLLMIWNWLTTPETVSTAVTRPFNPRDMEVRRQILTNIGTESVWTSDVVWQLHTWRSANHNGSRRDPSFAFALLSRNITCADAQYEDYSYYKHAYRQDQCRVKETFGKLRRQPNPAPMKEIRDGRESMLDVSTIIELVSKNDDVMAIVLVDNNMLWKKKLLEKQQLEQEHHEHQYAGHYVILCGTSSDPFHVQNAIGIEPDECIDDNNDHASSPSSSSVNQKGQPAYCLVLCNPAPESPAPYMYVTPRHFEIAWRANGTDEDIIFIHKGTCEKS